jgi:hypothetical protein
MSNDFSLIKYVDPPDRLIRRSLTLLVNEHCGHSEYGLASRRESRYKDNSDSFHKEELQKSYFDCFSKRKSMPQAIPHKFFKYPCVTDDYNGITNSKTERRIKQI